MNGSIAYFGTEKYLYLSHSKLSIEHYCSYSKEIRVNHIVSQKMQYLSSRFLLCMVLLIALLSWISPLFAASKIIIEGSIINFENDKFTQGCETFNAPSIKFSQTLYGSTKLKPRTEIPPMTTEFFTDQKFNTPLSADIVGVIEGENGQKRDYLEFSNNNFSDAYLQVIPINPNGGIIFHFEKGYFICLVSEHPKTPIPKKGSFRLVLPNLQDGKYAIAAQNLLPVSSGLGRTQFLVDAKTKEISYVVIEKSKPLNKSIDLGVLCIPPPKY
jgi:hypothetical protein